MSESVAEEDPESDVFEEAPGAVKVAKGAIDAVHALASRLVMAEARVQQLAEKNESLRKIAVEAVDVASAWRDMSQKAGAMHDALALSLRKALGV